MFNPKKRNKYLRISGFVLFAFIIGRPYSGCFDKLTTTFLQSSTAFAQTNTGTDARTTIKSSGTREGASKSSGSFPGFVKGLVSNSSTNERIVGASVGLNQSKKRVDSVETVDDGAYFFQVLPGSYDIVVDKSGFKTGRASVSVNAFETSSKNMDLTLSTGGSDEDTPSPVDSPTPDPGFTVIPVPDSTPTPEVPNDLSALIVSPVNAGRSIKLNNAVVSAFDNDGNPVSGITIKAAVNGKRVKVVPDSAVTGGGGRAQFQFRFGLLSKEGEIVFSAADVTASITFQSQR